MAHLTASSISISFLSLSFLLVFHYCLANHLTFQQQQQKRCEIQRIKAFESINQRVQAEGGWTDFFSPGNSNFRCAGFEFVRHQIQPRGLLLPYYLNTPLMLYIIQGRGLEGIVLPGCGETFQSSQQLQKKGSFQDHYQKIRRFQQGDVVVIPAGATHWMYNDGQEDVIVVIMFDYTSSTNQLDHFHRRFFLAGNIPKNIESPEEGSANIFQGFHLDILAEAFNIDEETAQKLQSFDDKRVHIIKVERELQVVESPTSQHDQQDNGLEETICSTKLTINVDDYSQADFYNPEAGWSTSINSYKLPILQMLKLSAERGVLHKNAIASPYWMMNAHNVLYVTSGNMRMQIVDNKGRAVLDDEVHEGQLMVIPQNFAVVKKAGEQGCGWISFRTNDKVMVNTLAGETSGIRAMPLGVIKSAYQMSSEEAWSVKYNRKETMMFEASVPV